MYAETAQEQNRNLAPSNLGAPVPAARRIVVEIGGEMAEVVANLAEWIRWKPEDVIIGLAANSLESWGGDERELLEAMFCTWARNDGARRVPVSWHEWIDEGKKAGTLPVTKPTIDGGDAESWEHVASEFDSKGDMRLARRARANVEQLRQQAATATATQPDAHAQNITAEHKRALQAEWQGHLQRLGKDNPELLREGSPLRQRVAELIRTVPALSMRGDGIIFAVEHAKTVLLADQLAAHVAAAEQAKAGQEASRQPRPATRSTKPRRSRHNSAKLRSELQN